VCLVGSSQTLVRARVEANLPRKRGPAVAGYDKAWAKFMDNVFAAVVRHVDWCAARRPARLRCPAAGARRRRRAPRRASSCKPQRARGQAPGQRPPLACHRAGSPALPLRPWPATHATHAAARQTHPCRAVVKCLVIAGPGFAKEAFKEYLDAEAVRREVRARQQPGRGPGRSPAAARPRPARPLRARARAAG
jgi:hypothetical protein